jgi:hypothetical protein
MSNWQNWYKSFLADKKEREMQAFLKGLNGEPYVAEPLNPKFDHTTDWNTLLSIASTADQNYVINLDGNVLRFNNSLLDTCYRKSLKNSVGYVSYPDSLVHKLIYIKLSDTGLSLFDLIKLIRQIPEEWFSDCMNCGHSNEDGWQLCSECKMTFEETLDL